jgi:OFA family oxalate/formate antiporter-like MFS transporter
MEELADIKPTPGEKIPARAWVVVFAGTALSLCFGILYAWSVWANALINVAKAGRLITEGPAAGWTYLTNAEAATPFSLCVIIFTLVRIPGGRIHDRLGPKVGAIAGGLCLALGCIIAGLSKSYGGLVFGFGILGGIGMGIGYAAPAPAALKWFGPDRRGLVAGLVLSGHGAAALCISPLAAYLIKAGGVTFSWIFLGIFVAVAGIIAGSLLAWPEPGYVPPSAPAKEGATPAKGVAPVDWAPGKMLRTWQFYVLAFMFSGALQSGLMIIGHATPFLAKAGKGVPFLVANAWILSSFGGLVNVGSEIGTGKYADILGRNKALALNCLVAAVCLFFLPQIITSQNIFLLFLAVGIAYWVYGGTLALIPAYTADFYGTKNLGMNYGLVLLGSGLSFFMARLAGLIRAWTGSLTWAFFLSAIVLIIVVILTRVTKRPLMAEE